MVFGENGLIEAKDKKDLKQKNEGKCSFTVRTWERKSQATWKTITKGNLLPIS